MQYDAIVIGAARPALLPPPYWRPKAGACGAGEREVSALSIGESLLPYGYFTLERIGVLDRMKASHFTRSTVCNSSAPADALPCILFFQQLDHEASATAGLA